ncbi:hypothetical protein Tco_0680786 [Tanacetum coccineum]|uniref:Uncharacterized protein n=1 Tax=Tanacetum coccineum TaxID=301880 RepID=A0ABQ4XN36_9ASTR
MELVLEQTQQGTSHEVSHDSCTRTSYSSWSTVLLPSKWTGTHDDCEEEILHRVLHLRHHLGSLLRCPTDSTSVHSSSDHSSLALPSEVCLAKILRASRSRGTDVEMDVVERSDEPHLEPMIDPVEMVIEACFYFVDIIRDDIPEPAQEERAGERDHRHRIIATGQRSADMSKRIRELERDNMRLRDMMDVTSQRVTRFQRRELRVQREMRQI